MRVVFVTHNELGLACLEELDDLEANLVGVFTRPREDSVADQADVIRFAQDSGIPVHEVHTLNSAPVVETIEGYEPDFLFVVGWSSLVDSTVLEIPRVAVIGMHPSPLPRGRGRAPIAWSLIKGLDETALSLFHLAEEPDSGDLIGQRRIPITETDDAASLYGKVVETGRALIREHYPALSRGEADRTPQNDVEATWWPRRRPEHGLIDWNRSSNAIHDWIRGQSTPYPGAFSYLDGQKVRVWASKPPVGERVFATPGELIDVRGRSIAVAAWEEVIELERIQIAGEPRRDGVALVEDYEFELGDVFENARDRLQ